MAQMHIKTNHLKKGMVITSDVYTRSGVILVPANTVVTKEVFDLLSRHFIDEVIIDYVTEAPPVRTAPKKITPQAVKEFRKTYQVAEETLSQNLKNIIQQDNDIDISALLGLLNSVIDKAEGEINLCDMLKHMQHSCDSLYSHSINVSLYAQLLGRWLDFTEEEIELISLAGLLHDIGHMKYPEQELKTFTLHDELTKSIHEQHPTHAYKILQQKNIDHRIKQAILTHHERMDGSGFPLSVSYTNINQTSRVLSIADCFVTLITEEPGHPALTPFEALKTLQETGYNKFDSKYLMTFIERISQSYIQHTVQLTNGQTGSIIMLNKLDITRPLIQVGSQFVDLSLKRDIAIAKFIDEFAEEN